MYKLFLYTSVFALTSFIIWVSVESLGVKIVLGIILFSLLVPQIRKKLYKTILVKRKFKVALNTAFIFTFVLGTYGFFSDPYNTGFDVVFVLLVVYIYSLIGNLIYGLPVSLLSDFISEKFINIRLFLSSVIHIGLGMVPFIFKDWGIIGIASLICSIIFLITDEFMKR